MKIGKIISVEFDKFRVKILDDCRQSTVSIDGQVYYFGNIGSYLKTFNSLGDIIVCEVVAIFENDSSVIQKQQHSQFNLDNSRVLLIKPIGTLSHEKHFTMGVGIFPSIYNDVEIVTTKDLYDILQSEQKQAEIVPGLHSSIAIGYSKNLLNYKVTLSINSLFNIHSAVLGNSGSGKSNTIARILQEVYRKRNNSAKGAKTILFDSNGEYPIAFCNAGLSEEVNTVFYKPFKGELHLSDDSRIEYTPFFLPYYLLSLDEWLAFLMASDRSQKPFWDKTLQMTYKFYSIFNSEEKDDKKNVAKYVNYFKWKILGIIDLILSQIDSDTAKITAARGIVGRCVNIINELSKNEELLDFINEINNRCGINYGNNDSKLQEYANNQRKGIDEDLAWEVEDKKLSHGDYYDYKFLHTAVEMVLLEEEARGNARIREFTSTMLTRLDFFLNNNECLFMRDIEHKFKNTKEYLKSMFNIGAEEKSNQLITIDSSEVGTDVLELMTSVVSRMIFDFRKEKIGSDRRHEPVHLILDEAHRYIRKDGNYILRENIFEKIAREGRKYSLFLMVSSQRPSELSSTVLSQCANFIVHRIQNEVDLKYVYAILPYFSDDFITKIKQSVPGEALIFGNCVPMPLQVQVIQASPDPNSKNCEVDKEWFLTEDELF